jgi:hypothetical protein
VLGGVATRCPGSIQQAIEDSSGHARCGQCAQEHHRKHRRALRRARGTDSPSKGIHGEIRDEKSDGTSAAGGQSEAEPLIAVAATDCQSYAPNSRHDEGCWHEQQSEYDMDGHIREATLLDKETLKVAEQKARCDDRRPEAYGSGK